MATQNSASNARYKFILASFVGILFFLFPIEQGGNYTIGLGILTDKVKYAVAGQLPLMITITICLAALLTLVYSLRPFGGEKFATLFKTTTVWTALRLLGAIITLMVFTSTGPEMIIAKGTGQTMFNDLAPTIFVLFILAGLFLPFLTDYGLMEFIGTLLRRPFKTLFKVPGRSAVDAVASWMGSGTLGVVITTQQYQKGYYNQREASIIATNFSVVSTAFCLTIAEIIRIDHMFFSYYFSIVICGIFAALIMPRIPPLSNIPDLYVDGHEGSMRHDPPSELPILTLALEKATKRAEQASTVAHSIKEGLFSGVLIWVTLLPLVMAVGTLVLIVAEYTSVFNIISTPIQWVLEAVNIPEADKAAPGFLVGFADQFLPPILAQGIESETTRFLIGVMAVTQLIYMSEIGVILLQSGLPLSIGRLAIIFLQRTIIITPLAIYLSFYFTT